jgi:hypothetical protein
MHFGTNGHLVLIPQGETDAHDPRFDLAAMAGLAARERGIKSIQMHQQPVAGFFRR